MHPQGAWQTLYIGNAMLQAPTCLHSLQIVAGNNERRAAYLKQLPEGLVLLLQVVALFPPLRDGGAVEDHHVEERVQQQYSVRLYGLHIQQHLHASILHVIYASLPEKPSAGLCLPTRRAGFCILTDQREKHKAQEVLSQPR